MQQYLILQGIGYALSSKGDTFIGSAVEEFTRIRNGEKAKGTPGVSLYNPVGSILGLLGGTEEDYTVLNMMTGMSMEYASAYMQTYRQLYDTKGNIKGYTSNTFRTPETYYNIRAKSGNLNLGSQQAVTRTYGNIINPEYISTANPLKGQYTIPKNLNEQIFYENVKANPLQGGELHNMNNDPNFSKALGFQKKEAIYELSNGEKIIIHYQYRKFTENDKTIEKVYDMKFIGERPR